MLKKRLNKINRFLGRINLLTQIELDERNIFQELEKLTRKESAAYIYEHIAKAILFKSDEDYWTHLITNIPETGLIMEFGVWKGRSINFMAQHLLDNSDKRTFYGFDSFEGLSEDFGGTTLTKGAFSTDGKMPEVLQNVKLIKGWVDDTLLPFLDKLKKEEREVAYVHLDMDVYSPTKFVLENIIEHLKPGSIIDFDELVGFPGWKQAEYKALKETLDGNCKYEHIAFCELNESKKPFKGIIKAAIRITDI